MTATTATATTSRAPRRPSARPAAAASTSASAANRAARPPAAARPAVAAAATSPPRLPPLRPTATSPIAASASARTNGVGGGGGGGVGTLRRGPDASSALTPFPTVEDRVSASTELWARDLHELLEHSRERFSDVSWETEGGERVWAHKAVVYVRAPKAFKDRYFLSSKTIAISRSPTSLGAPSPTPFSVSTLHPPSARNTPSPSFYRRGSSLSVDTAESDGTLRAPTLSTGGGSEQGSGIGVLRLGHDDAPELFRAQLEWLYTGEGFGDVVEWISEDHSNGGGSVRDSLGRRGDLAERRDKLGQDLTYMWTSKLYCDVRIHLDSPEGADYDSDTSDGSDDSLSATVIFTAHRFMLVSRSPYFASLLLNAGLFRPATADIHLPTPPFTPAALHFCLGWIYAGHLDFSNRSFDLLTAFQIHRAATYLQLDVLVNEIESRLVYDFCHGLEWNHCHCRRCVTRVSRVWRFAGSSDVGSLEIQRRARRFILAGWAECWNREVASADESERLDLVKDVINKLGPANVVSAFRGIVRVRARMEHGIRTKGAEASVWVDALGDMVDPVEVQARQVLATSFTELCGSKELWNLLNGIGFNDDLLDMVLREIVGAAGRVGSFVSAPRMYQTMVSSLLLKVHPDTLEAALPPRSSARKKVEEAKEGILGHIRRRWMQIKDEGGFVGLEPWAIKEMSDEIDVPIDELLSPPQVPFPRSRDNGFPRTSSRAVGLHEAGRSAQQSDHAPTRKTRVSTSSHASTSTSTAASASTLRRTPTTPEAPEANGLRRLRLSSSASTTSAASVRTAASRTRTVSTPRPPALPIDGPLARSPTAASKTPLVSVGSSRKRIPSAGSSSQSPTPSARPVMTGPPRPLLTGMNKGKAVSKPNRSAASSPTPRAGSPTLLRHQPSVSSVRSSTSAQSTATTRSTTTSKTTTTSRSGATVRSTATSKSTAPRTSSTTSRVPPLPTRTRTVSTTSTKSTKSKAPSGSSSLAPSLPNAPARPASRPSLPNKASATSSRTGTAAAGTARPVPKVPPRTSSSRTTTTSTPQSTTAARTPALRPSTSTKSLRNAQPPVPTKPTPLPTGGAAPKTPATKAMAKTGPGRPATAASTRSPPIHLSPGTPLNPRVRATSLTPGSAPNSETRPRTKSAAAPWKRATPLPPGRAGPRNSTGKDVPSTLSPSKSAPSVAAAGPRASLSSRGSRTRTGSGPVANAAARTARSPTGSMSTEGPPEAITPRIDAELIVELAESRPASPSHSSIDVGDKGTDPESAEPETPSDATYPPETPSDHVDIQVTDTETDPSPPSTATSSVQPIPAEVRVTAPAEKAPEEDVAAVRITPPDGEGAAAEATPPAQPLAAQSQSFSPSKLTPLSATPLTPVPESPSTLPPTPKPATPAALDLTSPASPLSAVPVSASGPSTPKATTHVAASPPKVPILSTPVPPTPVRANAPPTPAATPPAKSSPTLSYTPSVPTPSAVNGKAPPPRKMSTSSTRLSNVSSVSSFSSAYQAAQGSPRSPVTRLVSDSGSVRSVSSVFRPHPALAFDPPPRAPPAAPALPKDEVVDDEYEPFTDKVSGVSLRVGIPCIVTLSGQRRARFRGNVKYLGGVVGSRGAWVGLEVDDLERLGVETLPGGVKDGVRYFHFTPPAPTAQSSEQERERAVRLRRIATIADSLPARPRYRPVAMPHVHGLNGLGLGGMPGAGLAPPDMGRRAASPFASAEWGPPEHPRALFVRPSDVVFVVGAE